MSLRDADRVARSGGIVRAARRPPGWQAPGPPPNPPADASTLGPREGEDLCYLSGDWRIFQRLDGHRWSLDDLVTAWVAAGLGSNPKRIADLGCGIGSVFLMTAWSYPEATLFGIEAQEVSVELARRSVTWNGVDRRVTVHHGDFRDGRALRGQAPFDLVTGTPPYFPPGAGTESNRPQFGPCHFEHRGGPEEYCRAAAEILSPEGAVVLCAGAGQHDRVSSGASEFGLRVVRRLPVIPREGKDILFSVYVLGRQEESSTDSAETVLVVRDREGRRSERFRRLRADMGLPP